MNINPLTARDLMAGVPNLFRELMNSIVEQEYWQGLQQLVKSGNKTVSVSSIEESRIEAGGDLESKRDASILDAQQMLNNKITDGGGKDNNKPGKLRKNLQIDIDDIEEDNKPLTHSPPLLNSAGLNNSRGV